MLRRCIILLQFCSVAVIAAAQQLPPLSDSIFKGDYVKLTGYANAEDSFLYKKLLGKFLVITSDFLQIPAKGIYSGKAEMQNGEEVYLDKVKLRKIKSDPPVFISKTIEEWKTSQFLNALDIPVATMENKKNAAKQTDDFLNSLAIDNAVAVKQQTPKAPQVTYTSILQQAAATAPDLTVTDWTKMSSLCNQLLDTAEREANLGNYYRALEFCNAAIRIHPNAPPAYMLRGRINYHFSMFRLAVKDMETVKNNFPGMRYYAQQNIDAWMPYARQQPLLPEEQEAVKNVAAAPAQKRAIQSTAITIACPKCGGAGTIQKFGRHTGWVDVTDAQGRKMYSEFRAIDGFYTETCSKCSGLGKITK